MTKCLGLLAVYLCLGVTALPLAAQAQTISESCPRPASGSVAAAAPELESSNGSLEVTLNFESDVDAAGTTRYCYVTSTGLLAPTFRVSPGDVLTIHLKNALSTAVANTAMMGMSTMSATPAAAAATDDCSANAMTSASTNMHFHGLNLAPICHQDEVIRTLVQPGQTFDYQLQIPANEPPGLYWYHPHAHGLSDMQVNGGATGAIVVEGIQDIVPALAGMTERTFLLRDQTIPSADQNPSDSNQPSWDISLNYVPILYPSYQPAVIQSGAGAQEFWRLVNSAADTLFNLQLLSNGTPQIVQVYAIDGVPVNGGPIAESTLFLPPGSRVEFVIATPPSGSSLQLVTTRWDAGPAGDSAPPRPVADIVPVSASAAADKLSRREWRKLPAPRTSTTSQRIAPRFSGLAAATPTTQRTLYFYEEGGDDVGGNAVFFITVDGQDPEVFSPNQAPNIVTHAGTVEDWTIQNRTTEDHIFHMHQIHYQVLAVNGAAVSDPAIRDTMRVDHYTGTGPYPSITVRMDFRDPTLVGSFVYHCHILDHEDHGMMGVIQVLPPPIATSLALSANPAVADLNTPISMSAAVAPASTGNAAATGYVTFNVDGSSISYPELVSNGLATFQTTFTTPGSHTVTASYSGDNTYASSQAAPLIFAVVPPGFTLNAASTSLTVVNNIGTAAITLSPVGGFTGQTTFTCSLPATFTEATCAMAPSTLSGAGQTTLTVTTKSPQQAAALAPASNGGGRILFAAGFVPFFCLALMLPARKGSGRNRSSRSWILLVALGIFATLAWNGCGGTPQKQVTSTPLDPGTPAGAYTATVTATSGKDSTALQQTLSLQVTVP